MTREEFDGIWVPRLGEKGASDLRRLRRRMITEVWAPIYAAAGAILLGTSVLGDIGGVLLLLFAVWCVVDLVMFQLRMRALLRERFGVRVKGLPSMSQRQFDRWCKIHGYQQPAE
jgi:hypothetical protein